MGRMGIYDQVKKAFQDIIGPELHTLRGEIQRLDQKIDGVDIKVGSLRTEMLSMKAELLAEIRRLDARIDGMDRELRTAIDIRGRLAALEARR
jgi:hypothetical protein